MLKLTYTDNQLSLDCLKQSLEDWINTRLLVSIRSSTSIMIESTTAAFLVSASFDLTHLEKFKGENIVEFCRCDTQSVEVVLKGIWVTSKVGSETGVFATQLEDKAELLLEQMFNCQFCHA